MVRVTPTLLFRHESLTHVGMELRDRFTVTNTAKDRVTVNTFRTLRSHKYTLDIEPCTAKIKPVCFCVALSVILLVAGSSHTHTRACVPGTHTSL